MLIAENIAFYYKNDKPVLKNINFKLERGKVLCLLGPNGTGKTTLLRCILGLLKVKKGHFLWNSQDMSKLSIRQRSQCMAYVPQSSELSFPYEVKEVVLMGRIAHLAPGSSPGEKDMEIVHDVMKKMGIFHIKDSIFQNLSGGEKQMVLMARALAQQATLLILDEPTASLDFANQVSALKMIRELSRQGFTVLMTSHSPDHAFLVADQVLMMRDGDIYASGSPEDIICEDNLTKLYKTTAAICQTNVLSAGKMAKVCIPLIEG